MVRLLVPAIAAAAAWLGASAEAPPADPPRPPAAAAPAAEEPAIDMRFVQVERVSLVLVPVTVSDRKGRPVPGLTRNDFLLLDSGRPRPIEYFATEADAPIAMAFLLDVSGSMRQGGRIDTAKSAIATFVDALGPRDRFGLIGFADAQVTWITDFTSDAGLFKSRLQVQRGFGKTALYDALAASPRLVDEGVQARKAIVLFTDGLDNASSLPALEAIHIARQVSLPIYVFHYIPVARDLLAEESRQAILLLERFARETGGVLFTVRRPEELQEAIGRIQADMRLQYVIGFQPPDQQRGAFRPLRLDVRRSGLRVRCRTGYYPG